MLCNPFSKLFLLLVLLLDGLTTTHAAPPYNFTQVNGPGALHTFVNGINDHGQIVGWYVDPDFTGHCFTYYKGIFTPLNVPGADLNCP